jgi:hypothetical protein
MKGNDQSHSDASF